MYEYTLSCQKSRFLDLNGQTLKSFCHYHCHPGIFLHGCLRNEKLHTPSVRVGTEELSVAKHLTC